MSGVVKAVIPAAGRGTRMRPFSSTVPKELAPIGARPAIHWVLEEAATAGIDEVVLVTGPDKALIRRAVESAIDASWLPALDLHWVVQPEPRGLGDAILRCRELVGAGPFALLLPDNLPLAPEYGLRPLLELHRSTGRDVAGVLELGSEASGRYGRSGLFEGRQVSDDRFEISRVLDKRPGLLSIPEGGRVHRMCGRSVWRPALFELLADLEPVDGELDEVPAVQRLAARDGLLGLVVPGPLFDVGHPQGLAAANAFALARGLPLGLG